MQKEYIMEPPLDVTLLLKVTAPAALNARTALKPKLHKREENDTITSYCKAVNYMLETYATDNAVAETDTDMMQFIQLSNKKPKGHSKPLWNKVLKSDREYDK